MNVCILIPAYNEAKTIGRLVERLAAQKWKVIVVDDGSTDNGGNLARDRGAFLIRHEKNHGKGASLQNGFDYAVQHGFDAVLAMDGDGQHALEDVPKFIEAFKQYGNCVITGNRMHDPQGMPAVRLWTNRIMSGIISILCRQKIPDTQCGFRLISVGVLKDIKLTCKDYEIETEVLIKASKKCYKIYSVPIQTIYLDEASKINPWVDTVRFIVYIVKEIFFFRS